MQAVHNGQCGLCNHFGEHHAKSSVLVTILSSKKADAEMLDVYQGEFRVRLRVVAAKGAQTLAGTLRYQACDHAACFPPRSLPVQVAITGK